MINIPTAKILKILVPVLKYGILFLKVALSMQGLGAAVPDTLGF